MTTFDEYQKFCRSTAVYPPVYIDIGKDGPDFKALPFVYPTLGLAGESGELAEKVKKIVRDSHGIITDEILLKIKKELGDICWYISEVSTQFGFSLSDVIDTNIAKLSNRVVNNTVHGSGDDR